MVYATIAFPERRPRNVGVFDYALSSSIAKKVKPGDILQAPFRNGSKAGIVLSLAKTTQVPVNKLKTITSSGELFLSKEQLELLWWLVEQTRSSHATALRVFIPEKPKKELYPAFIAAKNKPSTTVAELHFFDHMQQEDDFLVKFRFLESKQYVIISPDITTSKRIFSLLQHERGKNIYLLAGETSKSAKYRMWKHFASGKGGIIIGSRNALYMRYTSLRAIIVLREHDVQYQRIEQYPDTDLRTLSAITASTYHCDLFFTTFLPTLHNFARIKRGELRLITHPENIENVPAVEIIDKEQFYQKKQSTLLPEDLLNYINDKHDGAFFLLYNRKGLARFVACDDCGWQPQCSECESTYLTEQSKAGHLFCRVCKASATVPERCPRCGGTHLESKALGIESLAKRIKEKLPQKKISVVFKENYIDSETINADIIIGTSYALQYVPWRRITDVIVLDADISLCFPDFRSSEWTLARLRTLRAMMRPNARLLIPTRYPTSLALHALFDQKKCINWLEKENMERKNLHFPPFATLIKFEKIIDTIEARGAAEEQLLAGIQNIEKVTGIKVTASPIEPIPEIVKDGVRALVLARMPVYSVKVMELLHENFEKKWKITINPLDML